MSVFPGRVNAYFAVGLGHDHLMSLARTNEAARAADCFVLAPGPRELLASATKLLLARVLAGPATCREIAPFVSESFYH